MPHHDLLNALVSACQRHSGRTALESDDVRISYRDLLDEANSLAQRLREAGVNEQGAVMVKCSNHPSDFVAFLGVWIAGAAAVPVHRTSPPEVVTGIQAKAQCLACLDLLAGTWPTSFSLMPSEGVAGNERQDLLRGSALVIFTSGSTGQPKGAVLSHRAFYGKLIQNTRLFSPSAETVTLLVLNNTFSFGIWVALMTLLEGGRVVATARFTPAGFLHTLATKGITFVGVVPTMIRATFGTLTVGELEAARVRLKASGTLRQMVIGGEPLGKQLSASLRSFIEPATLYDVYGLTETSTSDFYLDPVDYPRREASIGKPAPGITYRVINDQGERCPPHVTGELQIMTPYIMAGYLGDEDLTKMAFSEGWFRTGDLATFDDEGYVTIVGRLKELIVRGGNKITPIEVERALMRCSGIANAMVTGLADPILGQRIHAFLIPRAGEVIDINLVVGELSELLEKFKCPDFYYVGASLPTGRTGKIDRGQLSSWIESGSLQPIER